jgi:hypothetical protein
VCLLMLLPGQNYELIAKGIFVTKISVSISAGKRFGLVCRALQGSTGAASRSRIKN